MSSYPPWIAYPSAPPVLRAVPDPPRLHWGWVLVLSMITLGIFGQVWLIVQSLWVRRVYGRSKALPWAIAYASILPVFFFAAFMIGFFGTLMHVGSGQISSLIDDIGTVVRLAIFAGWFAATYTLRGELEAKPIDIPLSGVMTFFFGTVYFQYHLHDYTVSDEVHAYLGPVRKELPMAPLPPQS